MRVKHEFDTPFTTSMDNSEDSIFYLIESKSNFSFSACAFQGDGLVFGVCFSNILDKTIIRFGSAL